VSNYAIEVALIMLFCCRNYTLQSMFIFSAAFFIVVQARRKGARVIVDPATYQELMERRSFLTRASIVV
jgi:hypothetical protein